MQPRNLKIWLLMIGALSSTTLALAQSPNAKDYSVPVNWRTTLEGEKDSCVMATVVPYISGTRAGTAREGSKRYDEYLIDKGGYELVLTYREEGFFAKTEVVPISNVQTFVFKKGEKGNQFDNRIRKYELTSDSVGTKPTTDNGSFSYLCKKPLTKNFSDNDCMTVSHLEGNCRFSNGRVRSAVIRTGFFGGGIAMDRAERISEQEMAVLNGEHQIGAVKLQEANQRTVESLKKMERENASVYDSPVNVCDPHLRDNEIRAGRPDPCPTIIIKLK